MNDPRYDKLATTLIQHSTKLQHGENILIETSDTPAAMTVALVRAAEKVGANVMVNLRHGPVTRALLQNATESSMKLNADVALHQMKQAQVYLGVRGGHNISELSDVASERMKLYTQHWLHPVHLEQRVKKTRWCILRFPTPSMAQQAQMSTEAFEEFFFDVCTMDYSKMQRACEPLQALMERTDRVLIQGPGTHLEFSYKDIGVIPCFGTHNIPDGECFTAPGAR
jgi:aminopeptidase